MQRPSLKLASGQVGLVVVDVQERLLPAMHDREGLLRRIVQLVRGCAILRVPTFVTEQYPKGLGRTVPEVASAIDRFSPLEKTAFSCCGAQGFVPALSAAKVMDVILTGMEAHVCVCQTALDLLDQGFRVFVVADAIGSRAVQSQQFGLDRMRQSGAIPVCVEMILFELLGRAGGEEFKKILDLVK